jgi:hypothetical protein
VLSNLDKASFAVHVAPGEAAHIAHVCF